jgi:hypothetical protein
MRWKANAAGGTGSYSFAWEGTDGLSGEDATTSKKYDREGKKTASVKITSAGKNITVSCGNGLEIFPKKEEKGLAAAFLAGFGKANRVESKQLILVRSESFFSRTF